MQRSQVGSRPSASSSPQVLLCFLGNYQQLQLFCVPQHQEENNRDKDGCGRDAL